MPEKSSMMDEITATMRQDAYAESRRLWREHYLAWLAERELPGKPTVAYRSDPTPHD